jgi:hypothetical protein
MSGAVPLVRIDGAACAPCDAWVRANGTPQGLKIVEIRVDEDAVAALKDPARAIVETARSAKLNEFFMVEGGQIFQVFANDPLAFQMASALPRVRVQPNALPRALELSGMLRRAFDAAAEGRYVQAAAEARQLEERLGADAPRDEVEARARAGFEVLQRAGLALRNSKAGGAASPPSGDVAPRALPQVSGAYAALAYLRSAGDDRGRFHKGMRPQLEKELSPARLAALDRKFAEAPPCTDVPAPVFQELSDLMFLDELASALDADLPPNSVEVRGKLPLDAWLARYDAALSMVERERLGWLAMPALLLERGGDRGIDLATSAVWKRVTKLALAHLASQRSLAEAHPDGFDVFSLFALAASPGTSRDPALRDAVSRVMGDAVRGRMGAARDPSAMLEAGIGVVALTMVVPGYAQSAQLGALAEAVGTKLDRDFAKERGWAMAALHGARALLGFLGGNQQAAESLPARWAEVLRGPELAHPMLGSLAVVAVSYVDLALRDKLEPQIANPKLVSPLRSSAREALAAAINGLAEGGPTTTDERELGLALGDFGDLALTAALAALRSEPPKETPATLTCEGGERWHPPGVKEALERALKKRRQLLGLSAIKGGDGPWVRRARLLALLGSDLLDSQLPGTKNGRFAIANADADRVVTQALDGWLEGPVADLSASVYRVVRTVNSGRGGADSTPPLGDVLRGFSALRRLFATDAGTSIFTFLDDAKGSAGLAAVALAGGSSVRIIETLARLAYESKAYDQGDLLLLSLLAVSGILDKEVRVHSSSVALAREFDRPVVLSLALHDATVRGGKNPQLLAQAVTRATQGSCRPGDASGVLDVEVALAELKRGDRKAALVRLTALLERAETRGLVLPEQTFRYRESNGKLEFYAEIGVPLARDFLDGGGTFNIGIGTDTRARKPGGLIEGRFDADGGSGKGREAAARHYAHVALLTSIVARLDGDVRLAHGAARRALATWLAGVKLGATTIAAGDAASTWPKDAASAVALAAQQAVDAGEPFLAGSLWGLLPRALGAKVTDMDVAALTGELPPTLSGIPDLETVAKRAGASLETLFAPSACTERVGSAGKFARVSCDDYPLALSLRIGDGLSVLPRLDGARTTDGAVCDAYRALDAFLGAADERRYDPDAFTRAVAALRRAGKAGDAASLLSNQRHPQHCSLELIEHARALSRDESLGMYLRADAVSVALTCSKVTADAADLELLDALTERQALPLRNFEVLLFAAELAKAGHPEALYAVTHRDGVIARWQRISPDVAGLVLLAQAVAEQLTGNAPSKLASQPTYDVLCTAHPSAERAPVCNLLGVLRSDDPATARAAAPEALQRFIDTARSVIAGQKKSSN